MLRETHLSASTNAGTYQYHAITNEDDKSGLEARMLVDLISFKNKCFHRRMAYRRKLSSDNACPQRRFVREFSSLMVTEVEFCEILSKFAHLQDKKESSEYQFYLD